MQAAKLIMERLKLALIIMVILIILLMAGAFFPMSDEEGKMIEENIERLGEGNLELGIFSNNMLVALLGIIPFAGPPLAGYIVFNTGRFLGWASIQTGIPANLMIAMMILIILLTGYGILELLGYGVAIAESITMSHIILRRRGLLRGELKMLLIAIAISALLLAIAAVIEAALVKSLGGIMESAVDSSSKIGRLK